MKLPYPLRTLIFLSLINGPLLEAASNYATPYSFTTIAGKAGIQGSTDGVGTNALFFDPSGIAQDTNGNVFVADSDNDTIRKIDSNGLVTTVAGQSGVQGNTDGIGTNALFSSPSGITLDTNGNLFVTDLGNGTNNTIRKIDSNGLVSTIAGGGAGNDTPGNSTPDGIGTNAVFASPSGITIDNHGNLFVADGGSVRKIDTNLAVTTVAGTGAPGHADGIGTNASFFYLSGIAIDGSGNLYVADEVNQKIRKISTNFVVTTLPATFNYPTDVAVDALQNIYVVDHYNNRICKIDSAGVLSVLAGNGKKGSADGIGAAARFYQPFGITVDGDGSIFVTDSGNNTIRKGVLAPVTQTITFFPLANRVFGASQFNLTATASSGLGVSFTSSDTNVATVSGNTVTIVGAGLTTITASQIGDSTYIAATASQILSVSKEPQTINGFGAIPSQTIGASPLSLSASTPSHSTVVFTSSNKKVATISGNSVTIVGAGFSTITVSVPASANYNAAVAYQVLQVAKATQSISFQTPSMEAFVKGSTFPLIATSQGGTVSFNSSNPKVISIKGNTATIHSIGNCTITAYQFGNQNYQAAFPVAIGVSVH